MYYNFLGTEKNVDVFAYYWRRLLDMLTMDYTSTWILLLLDMLTVYYTLIVLEKFFVMRSLFIMHIFYCI